MNDHVISTTHDHLSLTVSIPVVSNGIQFDVTSAQNIGTTINPPQALTFQVVTFDVVECVLVSQFIIEGAQSLDDKLTDAITRDISQGNVVDNISAGRCYIASITPIDGRNRKIIILTVPTRYLSTFLHLLATYHRCYLVSAGRIAASINKIRYFQRSGVDLYSIAIEIIIRIIILLAKHPPTDEITAGR